MIIGDLEYLMASLPYLSFRNSEEERKNVQSLLNHYGGMEYSESGFIEILDNEASKYLDTRSHQLFRALSLDSLHHERFRNCGSAIVADFARYLYELKLQVASLRRERRETHVHISPSKHGLPFQAGTPLEEEVDLLRMQWNKIEDLSAKHFSEQASLMAYKIKLMILLRWWSFDSENGIDIFNKLTTNA